MPTPTTVKISFWIFLIGLVLDVVAGIIMVISGAALAASGSSATVEGTTAGGAVFIATGIIALVFAAIQLLILWKMKAGRNWARIVLTILEILSLGSLFTGTSGIGITAVVFGVVAVVLMWVPVSNAYFRRA
ncbi:MULTISPECIES: hypothetical protein [Bacteria]|uniref:hypothetical protein n=1 Tax=Bacteria TaxID=2 RepID=UPI0018CF29B9